jgi:hypothetical protein
MEIVLVSRNLVLHGSLFLSWTCWKGKQFFFHFVSLGVRRHFKSILWLRLCALEPLRTPQTIADCISRQISSKKNVPSVICRIKKRFLCVCEARFAFVYTEKIIIEQKNEWIFVQCTPEVTLFLHFAICDNLPHCSLYHIRKLEKEKERGLKDCFVHRQRFQMVCVCII